MEKVWVRCCDGVSAIVFTVSYAVSLFFLAIVGSTLGALVGFLIGVKSQNNLFYSVVVGTIAGGKFLTNAFRMSISFWLSDDCFFLATFFNRTSNVKMRRGDCLNVATCFTCVASTNGFPSKDLALYVEVPLFK